MASVDELLSTLADDEDYITIDGNLRTITIPESIKNLGVYHDDSVNVLKFKMPKVCCGTDLSDFKIYINYVNANLVGDVYSVTDNAVSDGYITFSWVPGQTTFASEGDVTFVVCMRKYASDNTTVLKEFNTTIASLSVLPGLETDSAVVTNYSDIINQLITQWQSQINQLVPNFWNSTGRNQAKTDSQAYIDSKMIVIDKAAYDALTSYATGVVYLVRE